MHAARLLERMEGYKVPLVAEASALEWHYDEDRKSTLRVLQRGKETVLQPFHSAVSAAGWPISLVQSSRFKVQSGGSVEDGGAFARWPAALAGRRVTAGIQGGSTIAFGDTPYAEPLRDLVAQAHLLARRI
jgi:hypothetical protein